MSSPPKIPRPPSREVQVKGRSKPAGRNWIAWLVSLGLGIAAGALSYEWLPPVTDVFNDVVAAIF